MLLKHFVRPPSLHCGKQQFNCWELAEDLSWTGVKVKQKGVESNPETNHVFKKATDTSLQSFLC